MANYDVSVRMGIVDNVTRTLRKIQTSMDNVVKTAQAYNTVIERVTRSLNSMTVSANKAATATNKVATNMNKLTDRMDTKLIAGSARIYGVSRQMDTLKNNIGKTVSAQKHLNDSISMMGKTQSIKSYNHSINTLSINTRTATKEIDKFNKKLRSTRSSIDSLTLTIKRLAGGYIGMKGLESVLDISDTITLAEGRIAQLTDDVEGFMDAAYQMSQYTRTDYATNAQQMAKMWQLTGGNDGIFKSRDALVEFNELLNEMFILGGSGTREINASMYQLTQALSSGRLQGDELRSLAENAPYLINSLTDYIEKIYNAGKATDEQINLSYNDLKQLGAEGVLTSELIIDAILASGDSVREAFSNVDVTFEQIWVKFKNQMTRLAQPVLRMLNDIADSDAFAKTIQVIMKMFTVAMACLYPILQAVMMIGSFMSDNWSFIEPIIWGIVGALGVFLGYLALAKLYTFALGVVQGFQLLMSKGVGLSMVENNVALGIYNGLVPIATTFTNVLGAAKMFLAGATWAAVKAEYGLLAPLLLIVGVILSVVAAIYLVVWAYNKWTDSTVSAIGVIVGAFYGLYAAVYNVIAGMWNYLVEFAELIANIFNDPIYYAKLAFGSLAKGVLLAFRGIVSGISNAVRGVASSIEWLVNGTIDLINGMVGAYNATAGTIFGKIGTVNKVNMSTEFGKNTLSKIDSYIGQIDSWIGTSNGKRVDLSGYKMEYKDLSEYYNKGYNKGAGWEESIGGFFGGIKDIMNPDAYNLDNLTSNAGANGYDALNEYLGSIPNYDPSKYGGGSGSSASLPDDVTNAIEGIKGDTSDIVDNTKVSTEELKYLRDIAEREVINRFTTAEIKIENNMNNNINSDRDLDGIVNYITTEMYKAASSTAEGLHY